MTPTHLPPLSLYIHVPWCVRKCPYCDFNSHQASGELPETAYIDALLEDFRRDLDYVQGRELRSIFFGGGTPSLLSAPTYERLLRGLSGLCPFAADIEITLEANPGTAERQKFADYRALGINRLSIGVQSFSEEQLRKLGRIHDSDDGRRAIMLAHAAGFDNFNIDIMYGLEGQSLADAESDLIQALSFSPPHLSWYQLTIEPNTEFFKRPPALPPEGLLMDIQEQGLHLLAEKGLARYEVSAFARPGRQARHNLNYWLFGDYLGIGAGAHGKITGADGGAVVRTRKKRQPAHYLDCFANGSFTFTAETARVDPADLTLEFMLNALRLTGGFTADDYESRTGLAFRHIEKQINSLQRKGLLERAGAAIRTTPQGMQFLNSVLEEFV